MRTLFFFSLFLFAIKAFSACVDMNTDVSYDLLLSQHPDLTCQEVIARANKFLSQSLKRKLNGNCNLYILR
jgi:hypothetical protein